MLSRNKIKSHESVNRMNNLTTELFTCTLFYEKHEKQKYINNIIQLNYIYTSIQYPTTKIIQRM